MNNIIAIYKPVGPTSHDMIIKLRKIIGIKKIGHAGTLDPLAEGILVVGVGRAGTKKLNLEMIKNKEYIAEIKLGENSETDDQEGKKTKTGDIKPLKNEINKTIKKFIGKISQTPPKYSSIKINGRCAYKYARNNEEISLKSRPVYIKSIRIINYHYPILKLKINCGSGVYIRSLSKDIGCELKTGAYLYSLIRTKVGKFNIKNYIALDKIKDIKWE